MNYNHLFYFHTVARLGSQAAAARELGLRQSTISEQVRQVEALLGCRLFDRTNTGLRLTTDGQTAFEFTEVMFNAADRMLEAFDRAQPVRSVVQVGITSSVSRSLAADFLHPLFDDETLTPRIEHGSSATLMRKLGASELDIVLSDGKPAGSIAERLHTELATRLRLLLVARHAYDPSAPTLEIVHYTSGSPWRHEVDQSLEALGCTPDVVGESDDLGVLRIAALKGRGAVAVPRHVVSEDLADLRLRVLSELDCELPVYLSHSKESLHDAVKAVVQRLLSTAAGGGPLGR
ncbi:MAG: LysR family transcriptional regulator [Nannocystaceae bacterium]|nr:LysR family transcriptional regulator [bacterium]